MIRETSQIVRGTWTRLVSGRIPIHVWLLLAAQPAFLAVLRLDRPDARTSTSSYILGNTAALVCMILFLASHWLLIRYSADNRDRPGNILLWLFWAMVLPLALWLSAFFLQLDLGLSERPMLEFLFWLFVGAAHLTLATHGAGKAIGSPGRAFIDGLPLKASKFGAMMASMVIVTILPNLGGDYAYEFSGHIILYDISTVIIGILLTVLSVELWYRYSASPATNPL